MNRLIKFGMLATLPCVALFGGAAMAVEKAANQAAAKAAADKRGLLLEEMGDLMDRSLGPVVRGGAFDPAAVKATAAKMAALSAQMPAAFATDTRGFRVVTAARDEVWQTHPDFLAKAKAMDGALAALQKAASGTDRKAVSAAIIQVGQTCKSCHTGYKKD